MGFIFFCCFELFAVQILSQNAFTREIQPSRAEHFRKNIDRLPEHLFVYRIIFNAFHTYSDSSYIFSKTN